jgi:hypothetical protein
VTIFLPSGEKTAEVMPHVYFFNVCGVIDP